MSHPDFSLEHIGLAAQNTVALKDWYVRVLGAKVVFDNGHTPPAFLLELPGGVWIEIYASQSAVGDIGDNRLKGWRHLALNVKSIESAKALLESRGVVFSEPIKPAGGAGRVLFLTDLEGNLLHFVERPDNWLAKE